MLITEEKLSFKKVKVKVKQFHYWPTRPRGFWEVKASRFRDIGT
jgi:hypothetical protein